MFKPIYKEATIKTILISGEDEVIPDLPLQPNMKLVFSNNKNFYNNVIPNDFIGKECITHIIYPSTQENTIINIPGFLGVGYPATLTQMYIDIVGNSSPLWVFLEEDYVDE